MPQGTGSAYWPKMDTEWTISGQYCYGNELNPLIATYINT